MSGGEAVQGPPTTNADALRKVLHDHSQPPDELIGKLPRVTCGDCRNSPGKCCTKHDKKRCDGCKQYMTTGHVHIDYVGHAEATRILIEIDPTWTWEPVAWTDDGHPAITIRGATAEMWGRLTLLGKTLPCVGTAEAGKADVGKELIGDLLRNGAMRFGIGLQLWSKADRWEMAEAAADDEPPKPPPPPPPSPDWRAKFQDAVRDAHLTEAQVCMVADPERPLLDMYPDEDINLLRAAFSTAFNAKRERDKQQAKDAAGDTGTSTGDPAPQEPPASDDPPSDAGRSTSTRRR